MNKKVLLTGIVCVLVSIIIFIFADGPRRYYSGLFFLLISLIMFMQVVRQMRGNNK